MLISVPLFIIYNIINDKNIQFFNALRFLCIPKIIFHRPLLSDHHRHILLHIPALNCMNKLVYLQIHRFSKTHTIINI